MRLILFVVLSLMLVMPGHVCAEDDVARRSNTVTLYLENDLFGFKNKDRNYTHGTKVSWISQDLSDYKDNPLIPQWSHPVIECLPFMNEPGYQRSVSISLGQNIYTPEDITRTDLVEDDRPYAGISYLAVGFHNKNEREMNTFEIDLGIVGRHSYAEDCQTIIHQWIDSDEPRGWKYQLHDEPVLNLFFERKWKLFQKCQDGRFGCDLIPHLGFGAGNVFTGANAGGEVRIGWNLPNDFGTFLIRPGSDSNAPIDSSDPRFLGLFRRFGVHLFFAVDGNAVLKNILLDGNTFRDSHSVDKKYFVANLVGGVGMIINRFKITYSYVHQTKEFKTQKEPQRYGSISVSATF